jgi:hypothetical protein
MTRRKAVGPKVETLEPIHSCRLWKEEGGTKPTARHYASSRQAVWIAVTASDACSRMKTRICRISASVAMRIVNAAYAF